MKKIILASLLVVLTIAETQAGKPGEVDGLFKTSAVTHWIDGNLKKSKETCLAFYKEILMRSNTVAELREFIKLINADIPALMSSRIFFPTFKEDLGASLTLLAEEAVEKIALIEKQSSIRRRDSVAAKRNLSRVASELKDAAMTRPPAGRSEFFRFTDEEVRAHDLFRDGTARQTYVDATIRLARQRASLEADLGTA